MAASQNVEVEAAMFLHKLIQDSRDEPAKLATKLYVICQHMKMSGKEQTLPYQVVSRAMETIINQHGLDIEVLKSRLLSTIGAQIGDSGNANLMDKDGLGNPPSTSTTDMHFRGVPVGTWHSGSGNKAKEDAYGAPLQGVGVMKESKSGLAERETAIMRNRPPAGPSKGGSVGHGVYQSQRNSKLFEHESPSSLDSRSVNSQERHDTVKMDEQGHQKVGRKANAKRKRADSSSNVEGHTDNPQQLDTSNTGCNTRKGKLINKGDARGNFPERTQINPVLELQAGEPSNNMEMSTFRSGGPRDTGKTPTSQAPSFSGMPFKEQHLKQLRAQCLVFLAFRNRLLPRKQHLEIALGNSYSKEGDHADGSQRELIDHRTKELSLNDPSNNNEAMGAFGRPNDIIETERIHPGSSSTGSLVENESSYKDAENPKKIKNKRNPPSDQSVVVEDRKRLPAARRISQAEIQNQEAAESQVTQIETLEPESPMNSGRISSESNNEKDDLENDHQQIGRVDPVMGTSSQLKPKITSWTGIGSNNGSSKDIVAASKVQQELVLESTESVKPVST